MFLHFFVLQYWRDLTALCWDVVKHILVLLLCIDSNIVVIFSSWRHNISRIVSILFKMSMLPISPDPSCYSEFSVRMMKWKNMVSCCSLVVATMILVLVLDRCILLLNCYCVYCTLWYPCWDKGWDWSFFLLITWDRDKSLSCQLC